MAALAESSGSISKDADWNFPNFTLLQKPTASRKSKSKTKSTELTEPTEFVRGYVDGGFDSDNVRRVLEILDERQFTTFTKW